MLEVLRNCGSVIRNLISVFCIFYTPLDINSSYKVECVRSEVTFILSTGALIFLDLHQHAFIWLMLLLEAWKNEVEPKGYTVKESLGEFVL